MTIAITGATGFVGQAVLDQALARGLNVNALTRRDQPPRKGVTWVRGDLFDEAALAKLVTGADAILHIAGVVNAPDEAGFTAGNVTGTQNIVNAARNAEVSRFVHVSSLAARQPSLSDYGKSKRLAEEVVQTSSLDWTMVRPPAVYGPRDTEIFELFKAARWGVVPMPPPGRTSIIHASDLASLLLILCDSLPEASQRIYEPDDGREAGWSHTQLAKAIGYAIGKRIWAPSIPRVLLLGAAKFDRLVRGNRAKLTPDRANYMAYPDWVSSADKSVPAQLWSAKVSTKQGLEETAEWYRAQGWL